MKLRLSVFLAGAALALNASAQVRVLSTTIVPARPYVGDVVECSIVFDPGNARLEEGALSILPASASSEDVELVEAVLRRKSGAWTYTARFIAWTTGAVRVPVVLSSEVPFPDMLVNIASVVDDFGRSPPRYKDPLELRGTRLLVWGVAGALLLAVASTWSVVFGLLPWLRRMRRAWREGRAGRDFGRALDYLEKSSASLQADELWALLVKALRGYMSARTTCPYQAYTAREARTASPDNLSPEVAAETAALLAQGDDVRFARKPATQNAAQVIARSRALLEQVEEAVRDSLR